ncbi:MAG: hypothetical protein ABJF01_01090 [bacterium]
MPQNRREFLEQFGATAMLATVPFSPDVLRALAPRVGEGRAAAEDWDVTWADRIRGKYRAVFDVPEIDSGYGVWRASLWAQQYMEVLKAAPQDLSSVVVLRHNGIALAMQQSFWDKYEVSKKAPVKHPITEQPTDRNPVLLSSSRNEVPAMLDDVALDKYLSRGGIALACNLALDDMIALVTKKDGGTPEAARKTAIAGLVPGVILQPSGVFAALHAQDVGCKYLRAS